MEDSFSDFVPGHGVVLLRIREKRAPLMKRGFDHMRLKIDP
jgi:hypothetical protein